MYAALVVTPMTHVDGEGAYIQGRLGTHAFVRRDPRAGHTSSRTGMSKSNNSIKSVTNNSFLLTSKLVVSNSSFVFRPLIISNLVLVLAFIPFWLYFPFVWLSSALPCDYSPSFLLRLLQSTRNRILHPIRHRGPYRSFHARVPVSPSSSACRGEANLAYPRNVVVVPFGAKSLRESGGNR